MDGIITREAGDPGTYLQGLGELHVVEHGSLQHVDDLDERQQEEEAEENVTQDPVQCPRWP